nr:hypothetical protein CFP56_19191 [Quercus suber]
MVWSVKRLISKLDLTGSAIMSSLKTDCDSFTYVSNRLRCCTSLYKLLQLHDPFPGTEAMVSFQVVEQVPELDLSSNASDMLSSCKPKTSSDCTSDAGGRMTDILEILRRAAISNLRRVGRMLGRGFGKK